MVSNLHSRAAAEQRPCAGFFDLMPAIARVRAPLRHEMLALATGHGLVNWECPDVREAKDALLRKHADRFLNPIDGELFAAKPSRPVTFSTLDWRTFRTAIGDARIAFHSAMLFLCDSALSILETVEPFIA